MNNDISIEEPVVLEPGYLFCNAIRESVAAEDLCGHMDIGPIDTLDEATFKMQYNAFFGLSPLNSPTPSPPTTRPSTPDREAYEKELDLSFGTSPLSTPPESPCSSRSPSPVPVPQHPPINTLQLNSKARQNRRKGKEHHTKTRQRIHKEGNKNAKPHINSLKHVNETTCTQTTYNTCEIPSASMGFVALPDVGYGEISGHEELLEDRAFRLIRWHGRLTRAIVDKDGQVIIVLVGHPNNADWPTAPGNLRHSKVNTKELEQLQSHPSFQHITSFASSVFHTWAPNLHMHYANHLSGLLKDHPNLQQNFSNSVWSAAAFNFGPNTCTRKHRDAANLPYSWCSITALGDFDPTKGGHLVLWDLGLVIEFPARSTILLPSAAIAHSNTPIGPGEC